MCPRGDTDLDMYIGELFSLTYREDSLYDHILSASEEVLRIHSANIEKGRTLLKGILSDRE